MGVFTHEHVLAYVPGLLCMVCIFLLQAYAGCMHLEASSYAFCFDTLLVLSLYHWEGMLFILKAELTLSHFLSKSKTQYWAFQEFYFVS